MRRPMVWGRYLPTFSSASTIARASFSPNGNFNLARIRSAVFSRVSRVSCMFCGRMSDVFNLLSDVA